MQKSVKKLLKLAEKIMSGSQDPVHDLAHVRRVVENCETISRSFSLSESQKQALLLAAWWHDASRTLTKRPSFLLMPLVDDTLSALMLWYWTVRFRLFGPVAGMATRLIFCKSMGTGTVLRHLFLRKKNRILLDILVDADAIDLIHTDRTEILRELVDSSWLYQRGYKVFFHWFFLTKQFKLKTQAAKTLLIQALKRMLAWIEQTEIYQWHLEFMSRKQLDKHIFLGKRCVLELEQSF